MSATPENVLELFKVLPESDQQKVLQQILGLGVPTLPGGSLQNLFPAVKVSGGIISSEQVAEALDE